MPQAATIVGKAVLVRARSCLTLTNLDPHNRLVAVALVRSGAGRQTNAIARTGLFGDALVADCRAGVTR
jgi:hypothetical protein